MRQNFSTGQELVSEDLNTLQSRMERGLFDRILLEMLQRKTNGFFQGGLKVLYQSATDVVIKAGLGFQSIDTGAANPKVKPVAVDADLVLSLNSPDSSNPRIDVIAVRHGRYNAVQEDRKFKNEFTNAITTQPTVVATDWKAEILYLPGTPAASPVAPTVPAGYLPIARIDLAVSTGVASQSSITDLRSLLPLCSSANLTGSSDYDAIVGDTSLVGVTHSNLKSALDSSSDGWKILVLSGETVDTTPVVSKNNIHIIFKKGVTFTRGLATMGLKIDGNDCRVESARMKDFITGGDKAIRVSATANRTELIGCRYANCATTSDNLGNDTHIDVEFSE